ncbi:MAG: glycosyltransferase, partial [Dehalococcoidia bacterium]
VHVLLEAFQGLLARGHQPAPRLRIHGNLSWFPDYVRQLRSQLEGDAVEFLGEFDNQDALQIYAGIDVLVVPSVWWENSPTTMHEAMLTGTPIIASNFGGMADLVREGENGLLFQVDDAADLQRKMESLLQDPARLEELRGPGVPVKTIERDAADMEQRYLELLRAPAVAQASMSGA